MRTCRRIGKELRADPRSALAGLRAGVAGHVADCPGCHRRLAIARLAQRLVLVAADRVEPAPDFAERVLAGLRRIPPRPSPDAWHSARSFLPAFAAIAAALLLVYQMTGNEIGIKLDCMSLLSVEEPSASERLIFGRGPLDQDHVLAALLEEPGN